MLRLTILFAAVASSSNAFLLRSAAAGLTLQQSNGFEVTAHGLVQRSARITSFLVTSAGILPQNKSPHTVPRPARRRRDVRATVRNGQCASRVVRDAVDATSTRLRVVTDHTPATLTGRPARAGRPDAERDPEARGPPRVDRRPHRRVRRRPGQRRGARRGDARQVPGYCQRGVRESSDSRGRELLLVGRITL